MTAEDGSRRTRGRRLLAVAVIVTASTAVSACDLITQFAPDGPMPVPATEGVPERTLPPIADLQPQELRSSLAADGWRRIVVPGAEVALMVPPDWLVATVHDGLSDLGDFLSLPTDSARRADAIAAIDTELMLVYAQSGDDEPAILHLTGWRDADDRSTAYLVRVLIGSRLEDDQWFEFDSVRIGPGRGQRLHYWNIARDGRTYSTTEIVFRSPNRDPYTLSMLTYGDEADTNWEQFERIMLSLEPIG